MSRPHRRPVLILSTVMLAAGLTWSGGPATAEGDDSKIKQAIDQILADDRLVGGIAGVTVADATTGDTIYEHTANMHEMPASNTKLPTSAAAMELLGPDYRWDTDVLSEGSRVGTLLAGDLYLRGTGDPTMLAEDYDKLAAELAGTGVETISGKLIADDTRFDDVRLGHSWSADDESAYYSAQISALTVSPDTDYDSGTVVVEGSPGKKTGDPASVSLTPQTGYVNIENRGKTVDKGQPDTLHIEREHGSNTIVISGNIPLKASPTKEWVSVWEPTGYAADVFRAALKDHGIKVLGPTRLGQAAPAGAKELVSHSSMPLKELLIPFMKLSNNGHAEVLTKTMGYEASGVGSWGAGLAEIKTYLGKAGLDTAELVQVDGSGLSRRNFIPSREFGKLLFSVQQEPWFAEWYDSLPIACEADRFTGGTLRSRMCDTAAAGNVHAKTGSLTGASGLSGYVTDADGRKLIFSIVLNNYFAPSVKDIEDKIAIVLATHSESANTTLQAPSTRKATQRADLECAWMKPKAC